MVIGRYCPCQRINGLPIFIDDRIHFGVTQRLELLLGELMQAIARTRRLQSVTLRSLRNRVTRQAFAQ